MCLIDFGCWHRVDNVSNMGNCFSAPTQDDISLLRGSESIETSETLNIGPPPPYQVLLFSKCLYARLAVWLSRATQLFYVLLVVQFVGRVIRYDTRCYFNVCSKADISQLNLPHGNDN